ncbi:YdcF family protein [Phenylobacterium sp.]|uniref:YdcF family protein n=1 Tax=Phenylobacterium sp. TaxID=1871053 RepID=UPI00121DE57A|nr:YdcF family protein [Phenylobacterium sp.]THD61545.1 MAG: YdcF family protein [Phenylobacterium sp.]
MRWIVILASVALGAAVSLAAPPAALAQSPGYRFQHSDDPVLDADAYLLTLIGADQQAKAAVAADPNLAALAQRLAATRAAVLSACRTSAACPVAQLMLTDPEIAKAGDALARLAQPGAPLARLVRDQMRPSGRFQKHVGLDDPALMRAAWTETAQGVNRLIRVYALGEKPRYPEIDSISYDPAEPRFRGLLRGALESEADDPPTDPPLAPWSRFAFDLLVLNQRDEAARYDPPGSVLAEAGENARAFARARRTDWRAKPYTAIVVPGQGLEAGETRLSPGGLFRVRLAARRWREGKAPFLIVSGGHVHPNKTPWAEAIEMKQALVEQFGVPPEAVFVDPYARHTTTNIRNAVRLLFRAGAPMDRPMLVTTSQDQSRSIEAPSFAARNTAELGYAPLTAVRRLSPFDLAALPNIVSLHADLTDPLDP